MTPVGWWILYALFWLLVAVVGPILFIDCPWRGRAPRK